MNISEREEPSWDDIYKKVDEATTPQDIIGQMEAVRKKYSAYSVTLNIVTTDGKTIGFTISEDNHE